MHLLVLFLSILLHLDRNASLCLSGFAPCLACSVPCFACAFFLYNLLLSSLVAGLFAFFLYFAGIGPFALAFAPLLA